MIIDGMTMPDELEAWLDARLTERFERQKRAVLEGVIEMVCAMMSQQIRRDGEAQKLQLAEEFAKFDEGFVKLQSFIDQMQNLTGKLARIDHALVHGEPVDSTKMN
jgi:hypothetical protein